MQVTDDQPPRNTRRVYGWADLPADEALTHYSITDNNTGKIHKVSAKGKRRRVLEGLRRSPLLSASYARLSDHVDHLRRAGIGIETQLYKNDVETGRERYGVYTLQSEVTPLNKQEVM